MERKKLNSKNNSHLMETNLNLVEISRKRRYLRLAPILFFLYVVNFLDRVNLSYGIDAGMFKDLWASASSASLIAGIASALFIVAYATPQIFTNLQSPGSFRN